MNTEIDEICRRVISAIFDSGCRGLLIVAVVWAALKLLPRVNAATRHAAWFAVLLILAALPGAEFWDLRKDVGIPVEAGTPVAVEKAPAMMIEDFVPIEEPATIHFPETISLESYPADLPRRAEDSAPYLWKLSLPMFVATILVAGWIALASVRLVGLASQLCLLRGITRRALAAPADLKAICGGICREMRLRRNVKLLFSSEVSAPMVVGFLNPRVLIPQEIAGEGRIEPVLRHELAHVARWDDWANLVQQFFKAIFFFHPGVLIASRRLTAEREIACDDHALAALRAPKDYALFLTEFACRMRGRHFAAAPAAWSSNSQLKERIVMILDGKRNASPRVDRTRVGAMTAGAVALALVTLAVGPRLAFAENEKPKAETDIIVEPRVAPKVEAAVDVLPAVAATPSVSVTIPAVATIPAADVLPVADAPGAPRPPRGPRMGGGDDIERRLERLERMVESLMGGEKMKIKPDWKGPMALPTPGPTPMPPDHFHSEFPKNFGKEWKFDFDHEKIAKKAAEDAKREVDRARGEIDRAKRELERGKREGEWARERAELERERADKQRDRAERDRERAERDRDHDQGEKRLNEDRRSLERERKELEEQRRSIEKRIESLEKQIQKRNAENKNNENRNSDDSGPKEKK